MRLISRGVMWLIRSRTARTTMGTFLLVALWLAWWIFPERPLREYRIKGDYGLSSALINRLGTIAWIKTTTRALPASFGQRNWGTFYSWSDDPTYTLYRINLQTGEHRHFKSDDFFQQLKREEYERDFHEDTIEWPLALERTTTGWVCRDATTNEVIAAKECHEKTFVGEPAYPSDRRWLVVPEDRVDSHDGTIREIAYKWLNKRAKWREDSHLSVIDPANGKIVNVVNAWWIVRWLPDRETFWTASTTYSLSGDPTGIACRLWSVRFARPSWWLWALTVAISLAMAWDMRMGIHDRYR